MDIAYAVLILASDEAAYVNRHELIVDGDEIHVAPWPFLKYFEASHHDYFS